MQHRVDEHPSPVKKKNGDGDQLDKTSHHPILICKRCRNMMAQNNFMKSKDMARDIPMQDMVVHQTEASIPLEVVHGDEIR